jgi:hypothetical protein
VTKKRANKWVTFDERKLNPLGQRLLRLVQLHPSGSPWEFAKEALGEGRAGNLSTQLERLTADDPEASLKADQLVAYARAARVSLHWLVTGEGTENSGPYGEPQAEEMLRYPEQLQRAARALIELDGCTVKLAKFAADEAFAAHQAHGGGAPLTPQRWLEQLRYVLENAGKSGLRPSQKIKR